MGRYLLCGVEASLPYEVEELDIRLYTIEELCYFIYHNLALISDDFISDRLVYFIRDELKMPETAEKIERFYVSPSDQDSTLLMLLSDVGYFTDVELTEFQNRLVERRRKNGPERVRMRADMLAKKKRYQGAIRIYKTLLSGARDGRLPLQFYAEVQEQMANCYGHLSQFDRAIECMEQVYDQTRQERVLKKIYDICVLSGIDLPEYYFSRVPDQMLNKWQQDYWTRETIMKGSLNASETMQIFFKEPEEAREALNTYIQNKKEEYRGMLE